MSGDLQISFSFGSNSHDTSLARERTRNVEIAIGVEGQALRTSDAAIEHGNSAVRINLIYPIKARGRGPCNEEVSLGSKCQVVGRNTWLERSKYKRLAITRDLKNCAATVTHVKIVRSEEHTSELRSRGHLVCRLLLEKKQCGFTLLGCPRLLTHEPPAAVLSATEVATLLTLAHTGGDAGPGYAHADLIAPTDVLPLCL